MGGSILALILNYINVEFVSIANHPHIISLLLSTRIVLILCSLIYLLKDKFDFAVSAGRTMSHEVEHSLGFLYNTSHRLEQEIKSPNFPISALSSSAQELLASLPENLMDVADRTRTNVMMMVNEMSKENEKPSQSICSVNKSIKEALDTIALTEKQRELIHVTLDRDFNYLGYKNLFTNVIINIITNALHAIEKAEKGEIYITTSKLDSTITIQDTGSGIPAKILPNIFNENFTTKSKGKGKGIGLAFCKQVLDDMQGQINCESRENEFTRFVIYVPPRAD
jgi:two-component system, CAI-1 autoinducer sensor kinase/phosphatase CqsS